MSVRKLETSESEYLEIINSKTAVLFSAACQLSSEISEISIEMKKIIKRVWKIPRYLLSDY